MGSTDKDNPRTQFLNYVTDNLSVRDREEMEDRLLADQEFSDFMAVCEQELIDAYATGSFTSAEVEKLRPWIEGSERRIQRVALARALLQKQRVRRFSSKTALLALAACVLLTIGLVIRWSPWTQRRSRQSVPETQTTSSVPSPSATRPSAKPAQKADVILLVAERIRGERGQVPTFFIHPGSPMKLEILLATDAGSGYSLKIVRSGKSAPPIFAQSSLEPHSVNGQEYLSTTLTGEPLPPGTYDVILTRRGESLVSGFAINRQATQ